MTNGAKFGLVLGVAIVLIIGLVFFRQDDLAARTIRDRSRESALRKNAAVQTPATHISSPSN